MTHYQYYHQVSENCYKRKDQNTQYIVIALILFGIAVWFPVRYPGMSAFVTAGIAIIFAAGFVNRMFSSVLIDLDSQTITQKAGLLATTETVPLPDIESFSVNNRFYGVILISSALALVSKKDKQVYLLMGESLMNSKNMEVLLLETEKILGRR